MKIGAQKPAFSSICDVQSDRIKIRGKDLCSELVGKVSFSEYFYFLLTGRMPNPDQLSLLDAVLVTVAEHGMTPSVQAARMTLFAAPDALQAAVAAGILGCGTVALGTAEISGRFLFDISARSREEGKNLSEVATAALRELKATKRLVPGFGHPQHTSRDPREERLLSLAESRGVKGEYTGILELLAQLIPDVYGRVLPINASGAIAAVMLDTQFPVAALKGIPILARTAGLIANLHEELDRPIGFILAGAAATAVTYDGPSSDESSDAVESHEL